MFRHIRHLRHALHHVAASLARFGVFRFHRLSLGGHLVGVEVFAALEGFRRGFTVRGFFVNLFHAVGNASICALVVSLSNRSCLSFAFCMPDFVLTDRKPTTTNRGSWFDRLNNAVDFVTLRHQPPASVRALPYAT